MSNIYFLLLRVFCAFRWIILAMGGGGAISNERLDYMESESVYCDPSTYLVDRSASHLHCQIGGRGETDSERHGDLERFDGHRSRVGRK